MFALREGQVPLPLWTDPQWETLPPDCPPVIDSHVHLFPDRVFEAIWRWFETYGWHIRYPIYADSVVKFLQSRGVKMMVGLAYSHRPGMSRTLNGFMIDMMKRHKCLVGLATVLPGEPGAAQILIDAFEGGLRGVKLHCHVQAFQPSDFAATDVVYEVCERYQRPIVIHAGRMPSSDAYKVDCVALCSAERLEGVLRKYPRLRVCVPHLGGDEFEEYFALLAKYPNLYLDTTFVLGEYPLPLPADLKATFRNAMRQWNTRIMYGSDFPNLPYAWSRELQHLIRDYDLSTQELDNILHRNAEQFWGIAPVAHL